MASNPARTPRARRRSANLRSYLVEWPDDLRVRWSLNLAFMELGQYPAGVPAQYLIELDRFRSKLDVALF